MIRPCFLLPNGKEYGILKSDSTIGISAGLFLVFGAEVSVSLNLGSLLDELIDIYKDCMELVRK